MIIVRPHEAVGLELAVSCNLQRNCLDDVFAGVETIEEK